MDADISKGRQQRVAGHAEMTQDIAARTQKAHDDFAAKVKQAEDERQKQLADIGKHESQYGKENADAIARDQKAREAQPISEGPTAPQHEAVRGAQADVSRRNAKLFVPSGENPNLPPKSEAVGPKIFQPGTGGAGPQGRVGNEGSAARFTNESAYNLARKGSREAIMTLGRRGIEPPPNSRYIMGDVDTDRVVYNPREITRFGPTGEALRNMEAPEKGGRSRIIAPDTGVQGTKVPVGPQRFPGGEEKRFTPGTSPTGVERRTQAMQDYQNAIDTTPPGTPTPGEKLAQDTRIAQAGKPSGIEEGDARRFIAQDSELYARFRKLDAAANAGDRAAQKERDSMLVQAMNDLKKIQ
jgi:hypothetical protein